MVKCVNGGWKESRWFSKFFFGIRCEPRFLFGLRLQKSSTISVSLARLRKEEFITLFFKKEFNKFFSLGMLETRLRPIFIKNLDVSAMEVLFLIECSLNFNELGETVAFIFSVRIFLYHPSSFIVMKCFGEKFS